MPKLAVEFEHNDSELLLVYRPRDDDSWVYEKFDKGDELLIKGTFRLSKKHIFSAKTSPHGDADDNYFDDEPLKFLIATKKADYYWFNADILTVKFPVLIHSSASITWKWFTAERKTSIFRIIADLRPSRIVIGGEEPDAIPIKEFEELIDQFPTSHELKRYVLARVSAVVREYSDSEVDAERMYRNYVGKRLRKGVKNIIGLFRAAEIQKYQYLVHRLKEMLATEETYTESVWQQEILQIVLLLNPKYIKAVKSAPVRDTDRGANRQIDILLIDASGNIDVIEIKQPFDKCIVTEGQYRDNHIPLRELSGSVMQIEKYIYYLNRWGVAGEEALTTKYRNELPSQFSIKITNPSGIVIMGRDLNLSINQRRDFEVVKRKYKNVVDIITYDDLIRRLEAVLTKFTDA
jgi:Domain of unknown function (DUF4263)